MNQRRTRHVWLIFLALTFGCENKVVRSADEYFRDATNDFRSGSLSRSVEEYHELLDQHPFSDHTEEAELKIAHAQYLDGNYAEAIVALSDFQRRHPTSAHLPFIGYILGMCYAKQIDLIDRDQTAALNAQTYFLTVSRQYPDSPFATLARQQLTRCREHLAKHEFYVAEFYRRHDNESAQETRLLDLAAHYGDTSSAVDGLLQLAALYQAREQNDRAALAYQALANLHPGTAEAITAQQELQRIGLPKTRKASDPIDDLLALNGRQRTPGALETVQLPAFDLPRPPSRGGGAMPAMGPAFDPFGRGRSYY